MSRIDERALAEGKIAYDGSERRVVLYVLNTTEISIRSETANDRLYVLYRLTRPTQITTSLVWYCVSFLRMANTVQRRLLALISW